MSEITYRTNDPLRWGVGKGANLTPAEVDRNFFALAQTIEEAIAGGPDPSEISNIEVIGSQMTVFTSTGGVFGPFTLPVAMLHWRGTWTAGAAYEELDIVRHPPAGTFLVLRPHTAASTFSATATNATNQRLYHPLLPPAEGYGALSFTDLADTPENLGAPGQMLVVNGAGDALVFADVPDPPPPSVGEAPVDGVIYGRQDGAWVPVNPPDLGAEPYLHWRLLVTEVNGNPADTNGVQLLELQFLDAPGGAVLSTGGTASASSFQALRPPTKAFDGVEDDINDYFWTDFGAAPHWLAYEFTAPAAVNAVRVVPRGGAFVPTAFKIQASADGSTWADVWQVTGVTWADIGEAPWTILPQTFVRPGTGPLSWEDVTGKPSLFPPEAHTHDWSDIEDLPAVIEALPAALGADGKILQVVDGALEFVDPPEGTGGGIPDAPEDGSHYARKDGAWAAFTPGGGSGGGGAETFLELTDAPASYGSGNEGRMVSVNGTGDGLVFGFRIAGPMTPAAYDAIDPKDATTLYLIEEA